MDYLKGQEMTRPIFYTFSAIALMSASGCQTVAYHKDQIRDTQGERVTVGTAQREIRIGMPASEVAAALGSPNIVTTDEKRREVWIYDKISTENAYSSSSGGVSTLFIGLAAASGIGVGAGGNASSGASSTSQRTLTIIIKFDDNKRVRDFSYHTSRF